MAVDKKSDHYTSAKGYTDLDGMSRQFTFVDHDKKSTISFSNSSSDSLKEYREQLAKRILEYDPSLCPEVFLSFKTGENWSNKILSDEGVPIQVLRDLVTILENTNNLQD